MPPTSSRRVSATRVETDVIASQKADPSLVVAEITGGPVATPVQYQKHMTHHLLQTFPRRPLSTAAASRSWSATPSAC